ncbi:DctM TRAP-type C4-dicarboxylate transport system, small permease component [Rhabdaerophilaceae bacterium]
MTSFGLFLDKALRAAALLLLVALLASVVIGVVMRQIGQPVGWSDELAQHLLVWTGFVGWMIASRRRNHIRITVFLDRLGGFARVLAEVIIQLCVICFAVALLRFAIPLIGRNWDIEWVSLPLPSGLLYLPIPFAALVLVGQASLAIIEAIRGQTPPDSAPGVQPL